MDLSGNADKKNKFREKINQKSIGSLWSWKWESRWTAAVGNKWPVGQDRLFMAVQVSGSSISLTERATVGGRLTSALSGATSATLHGSHFAVSPKWVNISWRPAVNWPVTNETNKESNGTASHRSATDAIYQSLAAFGLFHIFFGQTHLPHFHLMSSFTFQEFVEFFWLIFHDFSLIILKV
jgi:hypothetical protein